MDLKGITWAGNIYEKFEAMCLEVEEVMYEDTVKYVENQVQKVGVSVKKFYSEVVQDLLPPSCVDPIKVPRQLLNHGNLTKKETEGERISKPTAQKSPLNDANRLSPPSPTVVVENTRSDVCSTKIKKLGVHRRPIGIKRLTQNNCPSKISRPMSAAAAISSVSFVRRDPEEAVVSKNKPIFSVSSDKTGSAESVRQEKDNSECALPASDKILSAESSMQKKDDSECTSSCHGLPTEGTSLKDSSFSESDSGFRTNGCEAESVGLDAVMSDEDKFGKNGSVSEISANFRSDTESGSEEVIVSYEDNFDMIENEEAAEPSDQVFEPVKKSNLEETCILVEGDELHSVSQGTPKHKSYKKKIREVFSSKLRSTRKQDQCVLDGKKTAEVVSEALTRVDSDKRKLVAHDSFESDWELL